MGVSLGVRTGTAEAYLRRWDAANRARQEGRGDGALRPGPAGGRRLALQFDLPESALEKGALRAGST